MKHCMIDLETMGTSPGCAIASIGAVIFNPEKGTVGDTALDKFYAVVDLASCQSVGLTMDAGTVYWWLSQSQKAREALCKEKKSLQEALQALSSWYAQHNAKRVWCHGATFDVPILDAAYRACGIGTPWKFWDVRDTRTIFDLSDVEIQRNTGIHHNALDDSINQADAVCRAYKRLGLAKAGDTAAPASEQCADLFGDLNG